MTTAFNRDVFAKLWCDHSIPSQRIADAIGITRACVSWHAKRMGLPSRAKLRRQIINDDVLRDMWAAGVATDEIARHFGVAHRSCVSNAARRLGLPKRQRGASGKMNGGWKPSITLEDYRQIQMARRMAESAAQAQRRMDAQARRLSA